MVLRKTRKNSAGHISVFLSKVPYFISKVQYFSKVMYFKSSSVFGLVKFRILSKVPYFK